MMTSSNFLICARRARRAATPRKRGDRTRRRAFLALIGGGATTLALPFAAQGQAHPLVGVLRINPKEFEQFVDPFRRDMRSLGWEADRDFDMAVRWAGGRNDQLPALANELVSLKPAVIVAFGTPGVRAVQRATSVIPIVGMSDDMVRAGLAASMSRPGGNTTGVSILGTELDVKRLELLHDFLPQARRFGILDDPTSNLASHLSRLEGAAHELGLELDALTAQTPEEISRALDALPARTLDGAVVLASPILNAARQLIISRLNSAKLPAIFEWPEAAADGLLLGYGPRVTLCYRHVAVLVEKILRGAHAGELPIEQPNVFTLAINAATARKLGLAIPSSLLLRADEVIE